MRPFLFKPVDLILVLLVLTIQIASCNKSSNGISTPTSSSFTWTYEGSSYTVTSDTAYQYNNNPTTYQIFVSPNSGFLFNINRKLSFNLSSFNVGQYNIQPIISQLNSFQFIDDTGLVLLGISGTLNITSNSNNLLSGNFSFILINPSGGTKPISGSFSNMTIVH